MQYLPRSLGCLAFVLCALLPTAAGAAPLDVIMRAYLNNSGAGADEFVSAPFAQSADISLVAGNLNVTGTLERDFAPDGITLRFTRGRIACLGGVDCASVGPGGESWNFQMRLDLPGLFLQPGAVRLSYELSGTSSGFVAGESGMFFSALDPFDLDVGDSLRTDLQGSFDYTMSRDFDVPRFAFDRPLSLLATFSSSTFFLHDSEILLPDSMIVRLGFDPVAVPIKVPGPAPILLLAAGLAGLALARRATRHRE